MDIAQTVYDNIMWYAGAVVVLTAAAAAYVVYYKKVKLQEHWHIPAAVFAIGAAVGGGLYWSKMPSGDDTTEES